MEKSCGLKKRNSPHNAVLNQLVLSLMNGRMSIYTSIDSIKLEIYQSHKFKRLHQFAQPYCHMVYMILKTIQNMMICSFKPKYMKIMMSYSSYNKMCLDLFHIILRYWLKAVKNIFQGLKLSFHNVMIKVHQLSLKI